ncbi:MAG: tetratricopeptide repeat protein [Bacteroidetes bacterium]|nr:tetratricopeptide repeat protein [Bacteroidota bacterium]
MISLKHHFKIIVIALVTFAGTITHVLSQNKIDSLLSVLKTAKKDTNKVLLLNELCAAYFAKDKEKTILYNAEALALAKELKFTNGLAKATNNLGILLQKNGDYDSSLVVQLEALELYKKINNAKGIAKTYGDICIVYWRRSEFVKALDMQLKALRLYEKLNDQKGIGYSYNMIGIIPNSVIK